jgi:hypothetical protein
MTEEFIQFIWRTRNFNFTDLKTTEGVTVEILDFGLPNSNAGPDFLLARMLIDGTEWAGSVEIHTRASEWNRHGHTTDPAYQTVILHVVLEEDIPVYAGMRRVNCIELYNRIDHSFIGKYLRLIAEETWVPCAHHLSLVPELHRNVWLDRMLAERLTSKFNVIDQFLKDTNEDWEVVFYYCLASAYGFKWNSAPFLRLARALPLRCIYKHIDSSIQTEAMLFGTAGFLNRIFNDEYPVALQKEYVHLSTKYNLHPLPEHAWTWGKLRPANFPSIRIAQFAALMPHFQGLFRALLESKNVDTLQSLFMVPVHPYWNSHSAFDRKASLPHRSLGADSAVSILINTVVPFMYCYGKRRGDTYASERALHLMTLLPGEQNTITKHWQEIGMTNAHAGESQGLIHLKREYCDRRSCVSCAIGNYIITANQQS